MKYSKSRELLSEEHRGLRTLAAETRVAAQQILDGAVPTLEPLRARLAELEIALAAHNRHEDELLSDIILTIDAWGPQRESVMREDHLIEHSAILKSLERCASLDDQLVAAQGANELVLRMLRHMDSEEREVLHPDILRDDVVAISGVSG